MGLARLEISNIRNLQSVRLDPNPGFNALYGANGSGKTSFLEALYLLGRGTSFRTKDLGRVVLNGAQGFFVSGKLTPSLATLGVEHHAGGTQFRVAGQSTRSRLELAEHLPLLFISPESQALISEGPQQRRRFLDWGVFHVEPGFLPAWRVYQRALKQRNKALGSPGVETAWDVELARAAEKITQIRRDYLSRLTPYVELYVQKLVQLENVSLSFASGWRQDLSYIEALKISLTQDREFGFTRQGPHRADVVVRLGNRLARDTVSRGQQKLLVFALLLAQVALLNEITAIQPVILIDELAAELDVIHRERVMLVLDELKAQIFITLTERRALAHNENIPIAWFHVEQGRVTPIK
jgi:DNA replication and repair protein RecF